MPRINPSQNVNTVPMELEVKNPKKVLNPELLAKKYAEQGKSLMRLQAGKRSKEKKIRIKNQKSGFDLLEKTKIKPNSGGMLTLGTNTIHEISKAYRSDMKEGRLHELPRTLVGETLGWGAGAVFAKLSGSKSAGLAGYTIGKTIGYHAIDDQANFHGQNWDDLKNQWKTGERPSFSDSLLRGVSQAALGPMLGTYIYENGLNFGK